jgi:hypothetical protein
MDCIAFKDMLERAPREASFHDSSLQVDDDLILSVFGMEGIGQARSMVPPPRFHTVRYHGLFAAHARGRYALTGRGLHDQRPTASAEAITAGAASATGTGAPITAAPAPAGALAKVSPAPPPPVAARISDQVVDPPPPPPTLNPDGLAGPDSPARARRLAWSDLFRRVWHEDVLACPLRVLLRGPRCGGEMRLVALIQDQAVAERILRHLGLSERAPPHTRRLVAEPPGPEVLYVD